MRHLDPFDVLGVISSLQSELIEGVSTIVVKINRLTFHPGVVCVSGIIYVALKYLQNTATPKES